MASTEGGLSAFVEVRVEQALARFRQVLPESELEDFRELLRHQLLTHPVALRLLKTGAPPPTVMESDDIDVMTGKPVGVPLRDKK